MDKFIFDQLELFIFFGDFRFNNSVSINNDLPSLIDRLLKFDPKLFSQVKDVLLFRRFNEISNIRDENIRYIHLQNRD